ncbi:MAG: flagellar biosynthesis protein FlhB [Planctomycetes bacterium]|nr:flagellar biosynthesis protein FlhB [Planctomycetota bacterium]
MPEGSGGEKSEQPTPKKRSDARGEGQVAFSSEINTSGMLLIGFTALSLFAPWFWATMSAMMRRAFEQDLARELDEARDLAALAMAYLPVAGWLLPLLGTLALAGIGLSLLQVGWHPTLKPLVPNFGRVNPLTGFGRVFGRRGLMRFVFSVVKMVLIASVAWHLLSVSIPGDIFVRGDLSGRLASEAKEMWELAMTLAAVLASVALGDYIFQRFQHTRDLMMTKQEIKEEYKQADGDPLVKGKIRQIQRQMAQRRMMQEVPKADVVITNPTHVAVALKYDKDAPNSAPIVVAKGYDGVAQRIKKIALENGITMVENIPLARALAKEVEIGRAIPVKWYAAVAEVLAMVYKLKKAR